MEGKLQRGNFFFFSLLSEFQQFGYQNTMLVFLHVMYKVYNILNSKNYRQMTLDP